LARPVRFCGCNRQRLYGSLYVPPCNSNLKAESQRHILAPAILVQLPWQLLKPRFHQQHREISASRCLNNIIYVFCMCKDVLKSWTACMLSNITTFGAVTLFGIVTFGITTFGIAILGI
jgi:hypothetical protein